MQLYHLACSALLLVQLALQEEIDPEFVCLDKKCYAISWISKRFAKSRAACIGNNGDLMTVKNSEQGEVIARFMAKVHKEDIRVWIGLECKDTCTDLQQPLRGFTWVTGDNDTDYTNWRTGEQMSDVSPLCVTVHKDGTWEETTCDYKADGYLCEISHSLSCSPLALPSIYPITYYHPALGIGNIWGHDFPPGTIAEISTDPDITELSCDDKSNGMVAWSRKTPDAWSCQIENGGCEYDCVDIRGTAECKCPPESELKADLRGCTKPCDPSPCSQDCIPESNPLGFLCMCFEGYTLAADGTTCEDIDDCAANPNICEHHCINTIGGFECRCKPGFEMVEDTCDPGDHCVTKCQDIDECDTIMCEHQCENYPGGHRCVCDEGFVIDQNDLRKCKEVCNKSECPADCAKPRLNCKCPQGYILHQNDKGEDVCTDIDECDGSPCDGLLCINTHGSYTCTCPEGYAIHNGVCIQATEAPSDIPMDTPPTSRPADLYSPQTTIMWGVCFGLLSMFVVLIAMLCHRIRRHYIYQHDLDYNYKNTDKDVVLKKIMMEPQWQL